MKYVIFKYKSVFMPVIIPEHVTHSQIKIEDAVPVSAGFFHLQNFPNEVIIHNQGSESLKLSPDFVRDKKLLERTLSGVGTSGFLDI